MRELWRMVLRMWAFVIREPEKGPQFDEPTDREWRRFLRFAWGAYVVFVVFLMVLAITGLYYG